MCQVRPCGDWGRPSQGRTALAESRGRRASFFGGDVQDAADGFQAFVLVFALPEDQDFSAGLFVVVVFVPVLFAGGAADAGGDGVAALGAIFVAVGPAVVAFEDQPAFEDEVGEVVLDQDVFGVVDAEFVEVGGDSAVELGGLGDDLAFGEVGAEQGAADELGAGAGALVDGFGEGEEADDERAAVGGRVGRAGQFGAGAVVVERGFEIGAVGRGSGLDEVGEAAGEVFVRAEAGRSPRRAIGGCPC